MDAQPQAEFYTKPSWFSYIKKFFTPKKTLLLLVLALIILISTLWIISSGKLTSPYTPQEKTTQQQLLDLILQDTNALNKPTEMSDAMFDLNKRNVDAIVKQINQALANNDTATAIEKGKALKGAIKQFGSIKLIVNIPQEIKLQHDPKGKYLEKYADADPATLKPLLETVDLLVSLDKTYVK